jgi:fructoselysine-6-P-deglycase FrlB-like protein
VTEEFKEQSSLLRSFQRSTLWSELGDDNGALILAGAGDSYAVSLCASFLTGPRVLAFDPYSLSEKVSWAKGRAVYIISISGETRSNIELAHALKDVARRTIGITCNPKSRLAADVDTIIELPFRPRSKSPGIASFTLSLAAALKVCGLDFECDFDEVLSRATRLSRRIRVASGRSVTYFAGNNEAYAASIYGAAKIYELLGGRSQASLLEEFGHMPLFSLSTSDTVNVIESSKLEKGPGLHERLKSGGYASALLHLDGGEIERIYLLIFAMQWATIHAARMKGLDAPYFLGAKKKLRISDEMIY